MKTSLLALASLALLATSTVSYAGCGANVNGGGTCDTSAPQHGVGHKVK